MDRETASYGLVSRRQTKESSGQTMSEKGDMDHQTPSQHDAAEEIEMLPAIFERMLDIHDVRMR